MEDKKNKRKLFKRIGAIVCAVAVTIVAFSLPFLGNFKSKFNSKNMVASADSYTASEFVSSNFLFITGNSAAPVVQNTIVFVSAYLTFTSSGYMATISNASGSVVYNSPVYSYSAGYVGGIPAPSGLFFSADASCDSPLFDFTKLVYCELTGYVSGDTITNHVKYYDELGNFVLLRFYCPAGYGFDNIVYSSRNYFVATELTDSEQYRMGYSNGYSAGESAGYVAGEDVGYNAGYSAGETIGYNNGYSQGVEAGGNYSFFSLISAVIDAPIQAFMGLFNFELLGINLAGFFTGLLTLAFIITIVRLVMP